MRPDRFKAREFGAVVHLRRMELPESERPLRAVGRLVDCAAGTLSKIERGKYMPNTVQFLALCALFDMSPLDYYRDPGPSPEARRFAQDVADRGDGQLPEGWREMTDEDLLDWAREEQVRLAEWTERD